MVEFDTARIKRYRLRKSLTVRAFAKQLGVSPSQVYRWETGQTTPTLRQLCRLLEMMGARADRFFRRSSNGGSG